MTRMFAAGIGVVLTLFAAAPEASAQKRPAAIGPGSGKIIRPAVGAAAAPSMASRAAVAASHATTRKVVRAAPPAARVRSTARTAPSAGHVRPVTRAPVRTAPTRTKTLARGAPTPQARKVRVVAAQRRRGPAAAALPPADPVDEAAPRSLSFHHVHTGESLTVTFWRDGRYVQRELDRLNAFLRDSRDDTSVQMDPELFDALWRIRHRLRSNGAYHVLSAYRSPPTNAWLASFTSGVASDSLHMRGQAMDVVLPGRTAGQLRAAALALGLGGVGYYPRSGFVHIDTGPRRQW